MIIGIDPGTTQSAWVCYQPEFDKCPVTTLDICDNLTLLEVLVGLSDRPLVAIEWIESYGMPVGREIFETVRWIGRFEQAFDGQVIYVSRREVKLHLCNSARAKDANVRQALIDRFGGTKRKAVGIKKAPGPLYGIRTHLWAALGVAVTCAETKLEATA